MRNNSCNSRKYENNIILLIFVVFSHFDCTHGCQPYANQIATYLKERHPEVPVVYFANGGSGYLHQQKDMHVDGLSIDWKISMAQAREVSGTFAILSSVCF